MQKVESGEFLGFWIHLFFAPLKPYFYRQSDINAPIVGTITPSVDAPLLILISYTGFESDLLGNRVRIVNLSKIESKTPGNMDIYPSNSECLNNFGVHYRDRSVERHSKYINHLTSLMSNIVSDKCS